MSKKICIRFHPSGEFETVYDDCITRRKGVSVVAVERFSNVEFEGGEWVARLPDGTEICRHELREECLKQEVNLAAQYIQNR